MINREYDTLSVLRDRYDVCDGATYMLHHDIFDLHHKIVCGDMTKDDVIQNLLDGTVVDLVCTDRNRPQF